MATDTESGGIPHIILVGMMGTGKTEIGRRLAKHLDRIFYDLDDEIVNSEQRSIPEIFAESGEEAFREIEHTMLVKILHNLPAVIATGGGTYIFERNRIIIDKYGISVQLSARTTSIWNRIGNEGGRPLLESDNAQEELERLMNLRKPLYDRARINIQTDREENQERLVTNILKAVYSIKGTKPETICHE